MIYKKRDIIKIIKLENVRDNLEDDDYPVSIQLYDDETVMIRAFNESGYCWTDINLTDLLIFLEENDIITINKSYKKKLRKLKIKKEV